MNEKKLHEQGEFDPEEVDQIADDILQADMRSQMNDLVDRVNNLASVYRIEGRAEDARNVLPEHFSSQVLRVPDGGRTRPKYYVTLTVNDLEPDDVTRVVKELVGYTREDRSFSISAYLESGEV